jgi:hypothetical protein
MRHWILVCCFITLLVTAAKGQNYIHDPLTQVVQDGKTLRDPFTGGFNNPQFWPVQLNTDGLTDLLVFDRNGNKVLPYINTGNVGSDAYRYDPQYEGFFPPMEHFVVTADFNCDGYEDLFTSYDDGLSVYKAVVVDGNVTYELEIEKLQYSEAGFSFDLAVGIIDIPGIADVNGDGDLDVLSFKLIGGFVDYFENQAVENGSDCGALELEHVNSCWGDFYESGVAKSVKLDSTCSESPAERSGMHAGSTFMIYDEEGDGDMDIVLGDLSFQNLNRLLNGGTSELAHITAQDTAFPGYNVPVDITTFPAPFLFDADNDGNKDMLVAPNKDGFSLNTDNVLFYQNISIDDTYNFSYQHDTLFTAQMIDVGTGARPFFFDHNNDGLLDMVVGNFGYFEAGAFKGQMALYENTGDAENPVFTLITRDYANMGIYGFRSLHPAFADLDGDGDTDMLVGEENGFVHFFRNNAAAGENANFVLAGPNYQGIDPGKFSTPALFDVNDDGLLDLVIGEQNGNLNYYENTGTAAAPVFSLVTEAWGGVDVRETGFLTGHSAPYIYPLTDGSLELYVGSESGRIYKYYPVDATTTLFPLISSFYNDIDEGTKTSVTLVDISADGIPELITGNDRGGVTMYRDKNTVVAIAAESYTPELRIFPNPTSGTIYVTAEIPVVMHYNIFDITGRNIQAGTLSPLILQPITLHFTQSGWYVLTIAKENGENLLVQPFIRE